MSEEFEANSRKGKIKVSYVKSENSRSDHKKRHNDQGGFRSKTGTFDKKKSRTLPEKQLSPKSKAWLSQFSDSHSSLSEEEDDVTHFEVDPISAQDQEFKSLLKNQRQNEVKIYGENACQAIFKHRKESIIKAWFVESITYRFKNTLSYLAQQKLGYNVVTKEELTKISGTEHHGGVCFVVKRRTPVELEQYIAKNPTKDCIIALEGVANPHNIGAIVRSAAHFGIKAIIHQDPSILESGAAVRTAEGGAEFITSIASSDFFDALATLQKAGYTLISTSSHQGKPLSKTQLPAKCVLLIGQEQDGLTDSTWQKGNLKISIDGTGQVESLNVSVATAIILSKWWQDTQHIKISGKI